MFRRYSSFITLLALIFSTPILVKEKYYIHNEHAVLNETTEPHLIRSDNSGVEFELSIPVFNLGNEPNETGGAQIININKSGRTSDIGKPDMPAYSVLLGLPAEAQASVNILSDISQSLSGPYNIVPVPRADFVPEDATSGSMVYDRDVDTYSSSNFYPASVVKIVDDAWLRDQRVIRIEIYPFQYNPTSGFLLWHKYLKVKVQFTGLSPFLFQKRNDIGNDAYDAILKGLVLNYDVARAWRSIPANKIYQPLSTGQAAVSGVYEPNFLGPRYKIIVDHDGLFKLSYEALQQAQPLSSHDPGTFHLYNQGRDVAFYVDDGGDGSFGNNDSLFFYGEKFRGDYMAQRYADENNNWITLTKQLSDGSLVTWHPQFNHYMMEKYTDKNVYWLTVGGTGGPQMAVLDGTPSGSSAPIPATYQATDRAERELRQWEQSFTSEDTWYWEFVTDLITHTYTTTLTALASGVYTAVIQGEVAAYSFDVNNSPDHHTRFSLNDMSTPLDDAYWDGKSRYHFKAEVPQTELVEGVNQLKFLNINDAYAFPMIMFDYFEVQYTRLFKADQNKIFFPGENAGTWRYQVGGFISDSVSIFDVTDPIAPTRIISPTVIGSEGTYTVTFLTTQAPGARYFITAGYESPNNLSYYQPPDFASMTQGADEILISHADFLPAAQELANYRTNHGLSTMVVNVEDLYSEFNDGILHPLAIKNFLGYTFAHWTKPPTYVLLIGDGSWHMKNTNPARYGSTPTYMPPNLSWVDPWLGQTDSPNLLATVVGSDILPDVMIGRLPVSTNTALSEVVSKIISYEGNPTQAWQRNLLFIADDTPDPAGDFVYQNEIIINEYMHPGFNPIRIYLDDYKDNNRCGTQTFPTGPTCTPVNRAITETVSTTGTLFVNYTGHANTQYWTSDKILLYQVANPNNPNKYNDIASMNNGNMLPVVLSMTCWDGYWFYPTTVSADPSLSEIWLRTAGRGAVAVFSATGLGVESGHLALLEGNYRAIFNNGIWNLGSMNLSGKLGVYQTGGNYDLINTYVTFGDPALRITSPFQIGINPPVREGISTPGGSVTYTIQVTNYSSVPDSITLSLTNNTWPASVQQAIGPLAPGESQSFDVTVNVPAYVDGGITDTAILTATSIGDRSKIATTTITTYRLFMQFLPIARK